MSTRDWTLGIDFGTSNTAAAHIGPVSGSVEALQLSHNRTTMSSSVFVESPDHMDVGDVALDKAETNPGGFIPAPKRTIPQGTITINGYDVPSSLPVSAVLRSVVDRAMAAHAGTAPTDLVLTHPEAWSPREIRVLLDAAASLGLDSSRIGMLSEPRAAAHYYSRSGSLTPGTRIAVFDFGGGTLDIAVLMANEEGTFDVVAARGDNGLGGKNFDATIRRWLDEQIEVRDPDLLTYLRGAAPLDVRFAVDDSIRRAKELLSEAPMATISVPGPRQVERFQITRDEFEEIITPALDRAVALTRATLTDAGVADPTDLEALYLTGGSSRIPLIHERLRDLGPIATLDDPKTVVAQGALSAAAPIVRGLGAGAAATAEPTTPLAAGGYDPRAGQFGGQFGGQGYSSPVAGGHGFGNQGYGSQAPGGQPYGAFGPAGDRSGSSSVTPGGAVDSHADRPATSSGRRPSRGVLIGAAVAGVVLLGGGAAAFALLGDDGSQTTQTSSGSGSGSAAPGSPTGGTQTPPTTKEAVLAALPPNLAQSFESCDISGQTDYGGMQLQCKVKKDSPMVAGLVDPTYLSMFVSSDVRHAQSKVVGIRQKMGFNPNDKVHEIVENSARTAAAHVSGPGGIDKNHYTVDYANSSTGVMVRFDDLTSVENAKTFLVRAGLIN